MKKVKNDSQPFIIYIIPMFVLPFAAFFMGLCFYISLLVFDGINFWSIYGTLLPAIILYLIIRAIKNGILYFIPREECYVEEKKLTYKRILFNKLILKEIKAPLLDIQDIIDKGSKIPKAYANSSNPLNYITIFFKPYERILIKMKSGKEYKIFVDADPYSFSQNYDNNKFIKNYNQLKEMVIEEQNKLFFNQKIENLNEKYNSSLDERYDFVLNKIIDEEKLFISEKDNNFIINGDSEAIKNLEIFKDTNFEEIDFYVFYVNYLSKKEYENKKVLVGYNGTDGKEVTMSKFKEDINEIRDSRSTLKKS
ncbi:hypothetical protein [Fusobacterium periodonticum]|uniref:Uncharacterized protein n=2 Tax=Fusobacterium periodonticum TaxID=860 RepID=A0AAD0HVJ4_9FUSO|nr:hypothetical protein [Fusobacterium periodonticum]AVQ25707.1 hypothetical protein C4N17_08480 [Fusobacterium periodonticum]KGE61897.1 hypothetical protein FSAG_001639 [Fusobacterium periodonticum 2_1_31]